MNPVGGDLMMIAVKGNVGIKENYAAVTHKSEELILR
jgi:hypothetical protein